MLTSRLSLDGSDYGLFPSSAIAPTELDTLFLIYHITGTLWILPLCLLFYDILLTLDKEVKHFWNIRTNFIHWLFFVILACDEFGLPQHHFILGLSNTIRMCTFWFQYTGYSTSIEHLSVAHTIAHTWCIDHGSRGSTNRNYDAFVSCDQSAWPVVWASRLRTNKYTVMELGLLGSLMTVLLGDSVLYFGGAMLWSLANFLAWYIQPLPFYGMFIGCHICFQSILGCRLLLNIRETADTCRNNGIMETSEADRDCSGTILTTNFSGWSV
ncbi:hypothetical protein K439DRAFT_198842 [Ramaria rubella]|nr:hypothetical protein K439DRAFT_198842 [Ramaria rubella]